MIQPVRGYDTNRSNLNHFFAVHRETESQVPSDADLEHPDSKTPDTGKFQVHFQPVFDCPPRAMISQICLQRKEDLTDADF